MAVSEDNTRLSVTVSNELKALLQNDAKKAGHSVSRQIAAILVDHYQSALSPTPINTKEPKNKADRQALVS